MLEAGRRHLICHPSGCKLNFISGSGEAFLEWEHELLCPAAACPGWIWSCLVSCGRTWASWRLGLFRQFSHTFYSLWTLPAQPWCSHGQQSMMERQLACSQDRVLIISFSLVSGTGQQMLDVAGESHTVIPMQFSVFLCLKIDIFFWRRILISVDLLMPAVVFQRKWLTITRTQKAGRANPQISCVIPCQGWMYTSPRLQRVQGAVALLLHSHGNTRSRFANRTDEWLFCWLKTRSICGLLRESGAKKKMY